MRSAIGVDIGGTFTKLGVVRADGLVDHHRRIPTAPPADSFFESIVREIECLRGGEEAGIGVSVAGFLDPARAAMIYNPNVPWLERYALKFALSKRFPMPVELEVDSHAAVELAIRTSITGSGLGGHAPLIGAACGLLPPDAIV